MEFQSDWIPTTETYLQFLDKVPDMKQFSICFRHLPDQYRTDHTILSYATPEFDNEIFLGIRILFELCIA